MLRFATSEEKLSAQRRNYELEVKNSLRVKEEASSPAYPISSLTLLSKQSQKLLCVSRKRPRFVVHDVKPPFNVEIANF